MLVGRGGVEPPTFHFSGGRSYQLSYLPERRSPYRSPFGLSESCPLRLSGTWPPSSSGPGPRPFTAVARVRIPLGVPRSPVRLRSDGESAAQRGRRIGRRVTAAH